MRFPLGKGHPESFGVGDAVLIGDFVTFYQGRQGKKVKTKGRNLPDVDVRKI